MLWAIDVGNTHTVIGLHDGSEWSSVWRLQTHGLETEDELATSLKALCDLAGEPFEVDSVIVGSVVPNINTTLERLGEKWLGCKVLFLKTGEQVDLTVRYHPAEAVGADRLANALAVLDFTSGPAIVVDFGTATTFDAISSDGAYLGGAILPGVEVSLEALVSRTAKLPQIQLRAPKHAIGSNTVEALQSGLMLGCAGAIETLIKKINEELGGKATVVSTGGLGETMSRLCPSIHRYEPHLTLDGLRIASKLMQNAE